MIRPLLFIAVWLFSLCGFAQNIPNGNFENWQVIQHKVLDGWVSAGNVSQSTDVYEGTYAIKLENKSDNQQRGFVASGPFVNNNLKGFAYNEQPLSVRFRAKYDLAAGDAAQVAVLFYLNGTPLAFVNESIEGNSADTFQYFSYPITWQLSTNPDSVAVLISSLNMDSASAKNDGYLIVDDFHFATISTRNKAVPNGNFETWQNNPRQTLANWFTTDEYLYQLTGTILPKPIVAKSSKGRGGTLAVEMTNTKLGNDIMPGVMFTGTDIETFETPSFPISGRYKYLEFFYAYKPQNGDSARIGLIMFKNGAAIGTVQKIIGDVANNYTQVAEEITYFSTDIPDSATVFIASCNPDNPKGETTWLLIDDVRLTDVPAHVFDLGVNKLAVYPNPFNNSFSVKGFDQIWGSNYAVTDMMGQTLKEGLLDQNTVIDMTDHPAGFYILQVNGLKINTSKIIVKQ
ncbi:MAG: T9SS type A sorting domain-containing protein [Flavobacteriales bacterium]|nr:T9SS type A sorting domain-containing protein [Flavobacteriales bacterium]